MKRFKNILCVIAPHADNRAAIGHAFALAESNQADVTAVSVIEDAAGPVAVDEHRRQVLDQLGAVGGAAANIVVLRGKAAEEIIRAVLHRGHDLVIKTADDGGLKERLLGGGDLQLLRHCPCPVWLVKPPAREKCRRILATIDADDSYPEHELDTRRALNRTVLELAASLALAELAELHIMHAWHAPGESMLRGAFVTKPESEVRQYVAAERARHDAALRREIDAFFATAAGRDARKVLMPHTHLVKGWPRDVIPEQAEALGIDVVVMGTVARTGIPGLIVGNTAESILNRLRCTVLAIKPPGFTSPVTPGP